MYLFKVENIRSRYFVDSVGIEAFLSSTPEQADIMRRSLRRGLKKLRKLPQQEPLRAEAIEMFEVSIEMLKEIKSGDISLIKLEGLAEISEEYVNKLEILARKEEEINVS